MTSRETCPVSPALPIYSGEPANAWYPAVWIAAMRNLLGRLHARQLPELLRIAEAWGVPLRGDSKGEVVGTLYRAMTSPGAMRDIWDRLDPGERALVVALADAP